MGKSKDASFSYVDKSEFQIFKGKFKERKRLNQKLKKNVSGRSCESGQKKKKTFWSKWLTAVRKSWSCGETRPPQVKSQVVATKSLDESLDWFEMAFDPEIKPSKFFIEPNKTELKAMITEYCGSSSCPVELFPEERPVLRNGSQEIRSAKTDKTNMNQEPLKPHNKSLVKNTKLAIEVEEPPQKTEPLLTSALFIHENLDGMVESAVFMEPNLPRDYAESKPSDEISQKSLRINNVHVSYQGRGKDKIIKTFKTTSEPTWEERKKIIHQQRLNENINYLVKQFVFFEAQDVADFPRLKDDLSLVKRDIRFNQSSGSTARDLSREVSPEILVNIKPFKEYLPENIRGNQKSLKSPGFAENQVCPAQNGSVRVPEKVDTEEVAEKCTRPVLKSTVTPLKKNDFVHDENNSLKANSMNHDHDTLTLSPVKNKANTVWSEPASDGLDSKTQSFSFWDMYNSYSKCKNLVQVEVELGNTSFQFQNRKQKKREDMIETDVEVEEDLLRSNKSLDAILDSLEDGDHDLIFQKNLSQFKKKISVMPRLDFRKSIFSTNKRGSPKVEDRVRQKLIRVENPLETENHIVKNVAKIADFSLGNSREKKIEIYRAKCLDLRTGLLWKSEKILENIYLMFCESTIINQILATRVEAKVFSSCQTLREVQDMQENNIILMIEVENPTNFNEALKKIELLSETPALLQKSHLVETKQSDTIAMFLYTNQMGSQKDLASIFKEIKESTDERFSDFPGTRHNCQLRPSTLKFKETLSGKCLEFSKEIKTDKEDGNKPKATESSLRENRFQTLTHVKVGDDTSRRAVLILNDPSYDYTVHIYEKTAGFLKLCCKFYSESNMLKTLVYERRHQSDSVVTNTKKGRASLEIKDLASGNWRSKNYPNVGPDDFHVFCFKSRENFKDDEEEITITCQYFLEKQITLFTETSKEEENEEKEEEDEKSKEPMYNHKRNFLLNNGMIVEKRRVKSNHASLKEMDFDHYSKKSASADEAEEWTYEKASVREKPHFDKNFALPKQLMLNRERETDKRITFQLRKSGANLKKELVAAINLIKGLNSCKEEAKGNNKQISLIILLSKN